MKRTNKETTAYEDILDYRNIEIYENPAISKRVGSINLSSFKHDPVVQDFVSRWFNALAYVQCNMGNLPPNIYYVLVNEMIRGRLGSNLQEMRDLHDVVYTLTTLGMTAKDIIILRSCAFSFEEITEIATAGNTVDNVLKYWKIANPLVEGIEGVTAGSCFQEFVIYPTRWRLQKCH
ncbi:MAG: hypothetical protein RR313_00260 [Anaerovoracaceae bacterium]